MANHNPFTLPELHHVGAIVADLDKTLEYYTKAFGVGPKITKLSFAPDREFQDGVEITPNVLNIARVELGPGTIRLELIEQPPDDGSNDFFHQRYAKRGEGLHHMSFLVDDYDEVVAAVTAKGVNVLTNAVIENVHKMGRVRAGYFEADMAGGILVEIIEAKGPKAVSEFPPNPVASGMEKNGFILPDLHHFGAAVEDLDKTCQFFSDVFGMGDQITKLKFSPKRLWNDSGELPKRELDIARIQLGPGPIRLELVEYPPDDPFMARGEGLQHLGFLVEDYEEAIAALKNQGVDSLVHCDNGDVYKMGKVRSGYLKSDEIGGIFFEILEVK